MAKGIILKWILDRQDVRLLSGFTWFSMGAIVDSYEDGNKLFSIKGKEILYQLSNIQVLRLFASSS
jgi:hypothetical protein